MSFTHKTFRTSNGSPSPSRRLVENALTYGVISIADEMSRRRVRAKKGTGMKAIILGSDDGTSIQSARINFYEDERGFEIDLIRRALDQTGGHQSRAARLLGMNPTTLNSKIKTYNINLRA